jgi:hypothetical protein
MNGWSLAARVDDRLANFAACSHAVEVFMKTGSHFLTRSDFGCADGDHKAWLTLSRTTMRAMRAWAEPGVT